ncbi:hypothetical protein FOL47_007389 [Perkinsus chesapeaki]|uniref:Uncharacterized protein n=1 Tax=Perkinsus chesapeaki TaxID=330153 RepID=A0A7J6LL28_PERCH|nr:hypothetical protein FOL47_007389 [Perkinsus chesapeaki]
MDKGDEEKTLMEAVKRRRVFKKCKEGTNPEEQLRIAGDIIDGEVERISKEWEKLTRQQPIPLNRMELRNECDRLMKEACIVIEFIFERATVKGTNLKDHLYLGVLTSSSIVYHIAIFSINHNIANIAIKHMAYIIRAIEACPTLRDTKYALWLVQLYTTLCCCVESSPHKEGLLNTYHNALKVAEEAVKSIDDLQKLENLAQPVPAHRQQIIDKAKLIVKGLHVKYEFWANSFANGKVSPGACAALLEQMGISDDSSCCDISPMDFLLEILKVPLSRIIHPASDGGDDDDNTDEPGSAAAAEQYSLLHNMRVELLKEVIEYGRKYLNCIEKICTKYEQLSQNLNVGEASEANEEGRAAAEDEDHEDSTAQSSVNAPLSVGAHATLIELTLRFQLKDELNDLLQVYKQRTKHRHVLNPPLIDIDVIVTRGDEEPAIPSGWGLLSGDLNRFSKTLKVSSMEGAANRGGVLPKFEPLPVDTYPESSKELPSHVYLIGRYFDPWKDDRVEQKGVNRISSLGLVFDRDLPVTDGRLNDNMEIHFLTKTIMPDYLKETVVMPYLKHMSNWF